MTDGPEHSETRDAVAQRLPSTPEGTLRTALAAFTLVNGISGVLLLAFPRFIWDTIGGAPDLYGVAYDSTRLSAGPLVALAVAGLLVLRNPKGQHSMVTVMVVAAGLIAVGGWWVLLVDDTPTNLWFEIVIPVVTTALAAYLAWARVRARKVLKG